MRVGRWHWHMTHEDCQRQRRTRGRLQELPKREDCPCSADQRFYSPCRMHAFRCDSSCLGVPTANHATACQAVQHLETWIQTAACVAVRTLTTPSVNPTSIIRLALGTLGLGCNIQASATAEKPRIRPGSL